MESPYKMEAEVDCCGECVTKVNGSTFIVRERSESCKNHLFLVPVNPWLGQLIVM